MTPKTPAAIQDRVTQILQEHAILVEQRSVCDASLTNPQRHLAQRRITELTDAMYDLGTELHELIGELGYETLGVPRLPRWS